MLIINGKIITMEGPVWNNGFVKVQDKKIISTGPMELLKDQDDQNILDVKGAWVMPGIIEAHAHIGITEEKWGSTGDDCNENTNPVTPGMRAIDAVNPMDPAFHDAIEAGITSVMTGPGSSNVIGGTFVFMKTHGRCVDNMVIKNPAAMKVALGENPKVEYGGKHTMPATRMGTAALLRKTLFAARDYYNKSMSKKQDSKNLEEQDLYDFNLEPFVPVFQKKIPLKVHAHRADDILTGIRIAKEFDLDMTIDHGTEAHLIVDEIKKSGFPVIVGTDLTSRNKLETQNMNFKTSGILDKAGVLVAITTDHPVALIQYLPLCAGLAVRQGLPVSQGLKAITINAAKICRVENRVGSIKPGKDADIAIFEGNPMEVFTRTMYTIIDGEIVYSYKDGD